jgi:3-oxoacyl-[acyl-carrier protein] reductase
MVMTTGTAVEDRTRAALVTGGTGGMGRVIAAKLAADGFDVAVAYAGDMEPADATVGDIEGYRRHGAAFEADVTVTDEKAVSDLFDAVEDGLGPVDVVVHTAGINRPGPVVDPPELSVYAASKAAVDALTRILAKELRGRDITVNAVAPGPTATPAFLASTPADEQKELAALPPLERLGSSGDIAGVVSFLAGPSARWVNGQVVYANGGFV